jgi:hypothetical protein
MMSSQSSGPYRGYLTPQLDHVSQVIKRLPEHHKLSTLQRPLTSEGRRALLFPYYVDLQYETWPEIGISSIAAFPRRITLVRNKGRYVTSVQKEYDFPMRECLYNYTGIHVYFAGKRDMSFNVPYVLAHCLAELNTGVARVHVFLSAGDSYLLVELSYSNGGFILTSYGFKVMDEYDNMNPPGEYEVEIDNFLSKFISDASTIIKIHNGNDAVNHHRIKLNSTKPYELASILICIARLRQGTDLTGDVVVGMIKADRKRNTSNQTSLVRQFSRKLWDHFGGNTPALIKFQKEKLGLSDGSTPTYVRFRPNPKIRKRPEGRQTTQSDQTRKARLNDTTRESS